MRSLPADGVTGPTWVSTRAHYSRFGIAPGNGRAHAAGSGLNDLTVALALQGVGHVLGEALFQRYPVGEVDVL